MLVTAAGSTKQGFHVRAAGVLHEHGSSDQPIKRQKSYYWGFLGHVELAMWWEAPITCITVIFKKYQFTFVENEADIHLLMLEKQGKTCCKCLEGVSNTASYSSLFLFTVNPTHLMLPAVWKVTSWISLQICARTQMMLHCSIYVQNTRSTVSVTKRCAWYTVQRSHLASFYYVNYALITL